VFVGDDQLVMLSKLKGKEELIGEIIGLLQSPMKNVISGLQGSGGQKIAGLVKTLEGKGRIKRHNRDGDTAARQTRYALPDSFSTTESNNPRKMADIKALGDQLVGLTVKEVNELAQYLKDEYKIEPAAAAVAVAAGPAAGGGEPWPKPRPAST
jgi:hypothetical protein